MINVPVLPCASWVTDVSRANDHCRGFLMLGFPVRRIPRGCEAH